MMQERKLDIDCLSAARQRICNIFGNGLPVYLSFSGGKDSLVLAHLTLELIRAKKIDGSLLRIEFIDEEAIFPCVERIVRQWRDLFMAMGVRFDWYCLEVKHYSCLNMLENDESFICWDRTKSEVWVRDPPDFAVRSHPCLYPRDDTYQAFLARIKDGIHMTGVRASESIQRRAFIQTLTASGISAATGTIAPIYDWLDLDVWRYLAEHDVEVPDAYLYLYQIGVSRRGLRISQFFSIDTAHTLNRIAEFYPGLMERILMREPSAYLVSLYWDSEMFRRSSATRRKLDDQADPIDQRKRLLDLLATPPEHLLRSKEAVLIMARYRGMLLKFGSLMTPEHFRAAADALTSGDPKARVVRALITNIAHAHHRGKSPINVQQAKGQTHTGAAAAGQ